MHSLLVAALLPRSASDAVTQAYLIIVAALLVMNVATGRRQRREGRGTWRRLIGVAVIVCLLQLMPFVVGLLIAMLPLTSGAYTDTSGAVGVIGLFNLVFLLTALAPPARFVHSRDPLPLVEDEAFLDRVGELAGRMGLPMPVVRLLPTGGGELQAQALAGGLVAPSLVVGDGILHRLAPDERDATMAHELAHIANGSLWWLTIAGPLAATAGVVSTFWLPRGLPFAFAVVVWVGLRHLISRHFEYDCDRRAAGVLGYRTTASALAKIHAASPLRDKGLLSFIVFATATHPSRDQRLAAIYEAAPPEDRPPVTWSPADLSRRRRAGWVAVVVWLVSLSTIPVWARWRPYSPWPTIVLAMIGLVPWLAVFLSLRSASRDMRRRQVARGRFRWLVSLLLSIVAGVVVWIWFSDQLQPKGTVASAVAVGLPLFLVWCLWSYLRGSGNRELVQQVAIAMQTRDFDKVFELAEAHPKPFSRSAVLRHNLGFATAIAGDRERAVEILEGLRKDEPGFAESVLVLAMLHVDEDRPAQALPLVDEIHARLPGDPAPLMLRGHVLHLLDRMEEAQECIEQALQLKPDSGNAHAVAAWIALARGDHQQAAQLLEKADELDPGTALLHQVRAELALTSDNPETARQQVERAIAASDANPYALLQKQTRALRERFAADAPQN